MPYQNNVRQTNFIENIIGRLGDLWWLGVFLWLLSEPWLFSPVCAKIPNFTYTMPLHLYIMLYLIK